MASSITAAEAREAAKKRAGDSSWVMTIVFTDFDKWYAISYVCAAVQQRYGLLPSSRNIATALTAWGAIKHHPMDYDTVKIARNFWEIVHGEMGTEDAIVRLGGKALDNGKAE